MSKYISIPAQREALVLMRKIVKFMTEDELNRFLVLSMGIVARLEKEVDDE